MLSDEDRLARRPRTPHPCVERIRSASRCLGMHVSCGCPAVGLSPPSRARWAGRGVPSAAEMRTCTNGRTDPRWAVCAGRG